MRNAALVLVTNKETSLLVNRIGAKYIEFFLDTGLPDSFYPNRFPMRDNGDDSNFFGSEVCIPERLCQ